MRVILDCDNTFGIADHDIDDALALFYLIHNPNVELIGVTTSFGNASGDVVWQATTKLTSLFDLAGLAIIRGAADPQDRTNDATEFIHEQVEHTGPVSLLVTGSATNIAGAFSDHPLRPRVVSYTGEKSQIVMMGGTTAPLIIGNRTMSELNISCDPDAVRTMLQSDLPCAFITGNVCLDAFADRKRVNWLARRLRRIGYPWVAPVLRGWCGKLENAYGVYGFHPWDLVAAVYLTDPDLFTSRDVYIDLSSNSIENGVLQVTDTKQNVVGITLPVALDVDGFWDKIGLIFG